MISFIVVCLFHQNRLHRRMSFSSNTEMQPSPQLDSSAPPNHSNCSNGCQQQLQNPPPTPTAAVAAAATAILGLREQQQLQPWL
jgi:hypothetical protein